MADQQTSSKVEVGEKKATSMANTSASSATTFKQSTSNVKESAAEIRAKSGGSSLADFLLHLEDYTPTVCGKHMSSIMFLLKSGVVSLMILCMKISSRFSSN